MNRECPLADLSLDGDWPICDTQGSAVAGSGVVLHVEEDHPGALVYFHSCLVVGFTISLDPISHSHQLMLIQEPFSNWVGFQP